MSRAEHQPIEVITLEIKHHRSIHLVQPDLITSAFVAKVARHSIPRGMDREDLRSIILDPVSQQIALIHPIAMGRANCLHIEPDDMLSVAHMRGAHTIYIVHYYPFLPDNPPREDILLLACLMDVALTKRIKVRDYILISHNSDYLSLGSLGLLPVSTAALGLD